MPLFEAIRLALGQIRAQKLKSFFTLLGVTIGVMFLIAVVSIVQGMGNYVETAIAGKFLGVNTATLRRYPDINLGDVSEAEWRAWHRREPITVEDANQVRDALPAGTRWAIQDRGWLDVTSRYVNGGPQVLAYAVTPQYFAIKDLGIASGRTFNTIEDQMGAPVVVIGTEVRDLYFPSLDPIGKVLKIGGLPFRVIGVLEKQGTVFSLPLDRQIIAPFHSALSRFIGQRRGIDGVVVQTPTPAQMSEVQGTVREVMRQRHHLRPEEPDDFSVETSESALSAWDKIKSFLVAAGVFLPAIGLVVGAMVIMNIMLVAVAERTREIGIRKSLGARRRDILAQFLVEAATLSTCGAMIGIGLGIGLSKLIAAVTPLPAAVAVWSIVLAVLVGGGVGIVAGIYPASRAARLDPIIALRAE